MTPHIDASAGDYATTVLLPGDPQRAAWIAETFLEGARCVNRVRGALGFTGLYRGAPVSIQSTGMGRPSFAIYLHELAGSYGVTTAIRIGTCGGLHERVRIRDLFVAEDAIMEQDLADGGAPVTPDAALLHHARQKARELELPWHSGPMLCSDVFYPQPHGRFDGAREVGKLAVDMETSALFSLAPSLGVRALSLCTVVDNPVTGEFVANSERQAVFAGMARLSLEVAVTA